MTNHPGDSLHLLGMYDCNEHFMIMGLCGPNCGQYLGELPASLQHKIDEIKFLQWAQQHNSVFRIVLI